MPTAVPAWAAAWPPAWPVSIPAHRSAAVARSPANPARADAASAIAAAADRDCPSHRDVAPSGRRRSRGTARGRPRRARQSPHRGSCEPRRTCRRCDAPCAEHTLSTGGVTPCVGYHTQRSTSRCHDQWNVLPLAALTAAVMLSCPLRRRCCVRLSVAWPLHPGCPPARKVLIGKRQPGGHRQARAIRAIVLHFAVGRKRAVVRGVGQPGSWAILIGPPRTRDPFRQQRVVPSS